MNYYDTFIKIAPDCQASEAVVPTSKRDQKTISQIEYELLAANPYKFTQEELLFTVYVQRERISKTELKTKRAALWKTFFDKPRACLRSSMLPKKYGWGLHFNSEGRIALVAMESEEYKKFVSGKGGLSVLAAMRSKKA